ncbi:MAG TPA: DMT family transporter [Hyphomicrobiaceae bacterium]|nr:DMT family transporter [Hyphomicrobiaceae bacterium]
MTQSLSALASLAMLGAVCLWSSATPVTKLAVAEIAVGEFVTLRLALAAAALWLIVAVTGAKAHLRGVGWRPLVMGLLEPGLVTLVVSVGLTMTSPVNGSVFWSLTPLLMPLLGYLVLGERLELAVLAAAAMAFAATMLLVWGQNQHGGGSWLGDMFVAGGVIASAVNALLARRTAQAGANPLVTSCWQLTAGAMLAALLAAFLPATGAHVFDASRPALLSLVYLGLVVSGGVFILSNYALRHLPVGRAGLFSCLVGPVGTAMAALLLGTELSSLDLVALAMVVGAVLLPSLLAWRRAPSR